MSDIPSDKLRHAAASMSTSARPRAVAIWLFVMAALVFAMVLLGGATRLTESGLSMVDWRPLMGVLPPLNQAEWLAVFQDYKAYPEYQQINEGMSLEAFKRIFWFEYAHRVLGRAIGLAFALPLLVFLLRRQVPAGYGLRLAGLFLLGGLQGLVGWWMVKSGLVNEPDVSHYRLATHLGLAVAIFAALLWTALDLAAGRARIATGLGLWLLVALFAQILLGALVAGLNAGLVYNSFPTMNGYWIPPELGFQSPLWRDLVENPVSVQFLHRLGAVLVAVLALAWAWRERAGGWRALLLALGVAGQFLLGVVTLLQQVPLGLGLAHQGGALLLLAIAVLLMHHRGRATPN